MRDRSALDWRAGAIAGIVGTICYTAFAETTNVVMNGAGAFVIPFRQMGAVILGTSALDANYSLFTAVSFGTIVHLVVGATFGIVVARVAALIGLQRKLGLILLGTFMGLGLYALNVFVVFPAAFPWFLGNDRLVQSIGHALLGAVAGAWLRPFPRNRFGSSRAG